MVECDSRSTMLGGTYEDITCECLVLPEQPYSVCDATKAIEKVDDKGWKANGIRLVRSTDGVAK